MRVQRGWGEQCRRAIGVVPRRLIVHYMRPIEMVVDGPQSVRLLASYQCTSVEYDAGQPVHLGVTPASD